MTAFGPQSKNAALALPTGTGVNRYGTDVDTWCRDCADLINNDGTVLDAAFFNMILGNIRYACVTEGVTLTDGNMTLLWQAIQNAAASSGLQTGSRGLVVNGTDVQLDLGNGTLSFITS